jgi:hypothetical protein
MKTKTWASVLAVCVVCAWGCEDKKPNEVGPDGVDPSAQKPEATTNGAGAATNGAKSETNGATNAAKDPEGDAPMEMEVDPAATDTVKMVDLKGKAPEEFEVEGELLDIWGWTDKGGMRVFAVSREKRASKSGEGMALIGRAAYREGDASWTDTRVFTELVEGCQFDIELSHQKGDWVIEDLDGDGNAEVTFAYHAGCRSDVSPVAHKVLIASGAEKYGMRGQTAVAADGKTYDMGGESKIDDALAKAPDSFKAHAKKVWELTVKEKM